MDPEDLMIRALMGQQGTADAEDLSARRRRQRPVRAPPAPPPVPLPPESPFPQQLNPAVMNRYIAENPHLGDRWTPTANRASIGPSYSAAPVDPFNILNPNKPQGFIPETPAPFDETFGLAQAMQQRYGGQ